jgi:coronin-7
VPTPPSNDKEANNLVNEDDCENIECIQEATEINELSLDSDEMDNKRCSIADRRKLYENRSTSLIEEKKKVLAPVGRGDSFKDNVDSKNLANQNSGSSHPKPTAISKRTSTVFGKVSKFRHLKGTTGHKSTHIENVKNINRQMSGESEGFHGKILLTHFSIAMNL